jgi:protein-L-isoaspartate(D-aspartate) O-methyltransferase
MDETARIRRRFADDLRDRIKVKSQAVVDAFATVPRENFLDPGPWTLKTDLGPVETPDADPAHLYQDVLVPLDEAKELNNGSPGLWAELFDALNVRSGEHVVHIGAGRGYYSAILAELAGPASRITCIEIEPRLARLANEALARWPQAHVVEADGFKAAIDTCDAIVLSAGVSHFPAAWLDALRPAGRLMLPLTVDGEWPGLGGVGTWRGGWGKVLLVTKMADGFDARFVRRCGFTNCVSGHAPEIDGRLRDSFARDQGDGVHSLRRAGDPRDDSCWFDAGEWWLSTNGPTEH